MVERIILIFSAVDDDVVITAGREGVGLAGGGGQDVEAGGVFAVDEPAEREFKLGILLALDAHGVGHAHAQGRFADGEVEGFRFAGREECALLLIGFQRGCSALDDDNLAVFKSGDGGVGDFEAHGAFGVVRRERGGERRVSISLVGDFTERDAGLALDEQRTADVLGKVVAVIFAAADNDVVITAGREGVGLAGGGGQDVEAGGVISVEEAAVGEDKCGILLALDAHRVAGNHLQRGFLYGEGDFFRFTLGVVGAALLYGFQGGRSAFEDMERTLLVFHNARGTEDKFHFGLVVVGGDGGGKRGVAVAFGVDAHERNHGLRQGGRPHGICSFGVIEIIAIVLAAADDERIEANGRGGRHFARHGGHQVDDRTFFPVDKAGDVEFEVGDRRLSHDARFVAATYFEGRFPDGQYTVEGRYCISLVGYFGECDGVVARYGGGSCLASNFGNLDVVFVVAVDKAFIHEGEGRVGLAILAALAFGLYGKGGFVHHQFGCRRCLAEVGRCGLVGGDGGLASFEYRHRAVADGGDAFIFDGEGDGGLGVG